MKQTSYSPPAHGRVPYLFGLFLTLCVISACTKPAPPTAVFTPTPTNPSLTLPIPDDDPLAVYTAVLKPNEQAILDSDTLHTATRYDMALTISDDLTQIDGQQTIIYTNNERVPLSDFYLRLYPNLAGGAISLNNLQRDGQLLDETTVAYELRDSAVRLPLVPPLQPGEQTTFMLDFTTAVPTSGGGNYGTFILDEGILAPAHFYPFVPVYDADEGWNVEIPSQLGDVIYGDSSFYRVTITAPAEQVIATSGVLVGQEIAPEGNAQTLTAVAGPMRDFYFIASDQFEVISATVDGTTVNHYGFPEFSASNQAALNTAVESVRTFNQLVGAYPFTELDIAMSPTWALGVEYPGIVVNSRNIYPPQAANALFTTTVHEVGHQWFYSLVGNDQLDEPWLDEALTQYLTLRFLQNDPTRQPLARGFENQLRGWSQLAQSENTPIGGAVVDYEDNPDLYGSAVYAAGPLFFVGLHEQIGAEAFDRFLQTYFARFRFGIATSADLQATLEETCGCVLDEAFDTAVYP